MKKISVLLIACLVLATGYSLPSRAENNPHDGTTRWYKMHAVGTYYGGYIQKDLSKADLSPSLIFRGPLTQTNNRADFLAASVPVYQIFVEFRNMERHFEADGTITATYDFVARTCPDRDVVVPMEEHFIVQQDGISNIEVKYDVTKLFPCGMPQQ